jgi:hypothetical protein
MEPCATRGVEAAEHASTLTHGKVMVGKACDKLARTYKSSKSNNKNYNYNQQEATS